MGGPEGAPKKEEEDVDPNAEGAGAGAPKRLVEEEAVPNKLPPGAGAVPNRPEEPGAGAGADPNRLLVVPPAGAGDPKKPPLGAGAGAPKLDVGAGDDPNMLPPGAGDGDPNAAGAPGAAGAGAPNVWTVFAPQLTMLDSGVLMEGFRKTRARLNVNPKSAAMSNQATQSSTRSSVMLWVPWSVVGSICAVCRRVAQSLKVFRLVRGKVGACTPAR